MTWSNNVTLCCAMPHGTPHVVSYLHILHTVSQNTSCFESEEGSVKPRPQREHLATPTTVSQKSTEEVLNCHHTNEVAPTGEGHLVATLPHLVHALTWYFTQTAWCMITSIIVIISYVTGSVHVCLLFNKNENKQQLLADQMVTARGFLRNWE